MKNLNSFCFALILLGCGSKYIAPVQDRLGANITTHQNETVLISEVPLNVKVMAIADSRCPTDVQCIWAGQASADFMTNGLSFQLSIGQSKEFNAGDKHLRLTLIDITPHPSSFNGGEKKSAVFVVHQI